MSKKSRKRNKKILAALALAGGAAMLAKGRGKGIAQGVSGADKAAFTSDAAYKLPSKAVVAADIAKDVVSSKVPERGRITVGGKGPMEIVRERQAMPGYGVEGPPSILNPYNPYQNISGKIGRKGGGIAKRGTGVALKSGGRVTGIAKRGFGRALMKGKK